MKIVVIMSVLSSLLLGIGCANLNTVRSEQESKQFQKANKPYRMLDILCVVDEDVSRKKVRKIISDSSNIFKEQTGISFSISEISQTSFNTSKFMDEEINNCLKQLWKSSQKKHFDVAVGFVSNDPMEQIFGYLFADYKGAIDDQYRRYIIIKYKDVHTFLHEITHAFILDKDHSIYGLMSPFALKLFPFLPGVNTSLYLAPADRKIVLRNKWRSFGPRLTSKN